ncbi:7624_t:CDS:2 [Paraglomus occultum]|uniref:7624_t:CDS:1 n=1 Tax=Paraglomus occultum TaxID=144539 RepID=A0A9N9CJS3_9GLOM|nr:7624_t:CDS:2 [Paraglomus occultum]
MAQSFIDARNMTSTDDYDELNESRNKNMVLVRSTFEFIIPGPFNTANRMFSPPFATSENMFWQLEFCPSGTSKDAHSAFLYLRAIPNEEELKVPQWPARNQFSPRIYLSHHNGLFSREKQLNKEFSGTSRKWGKPICKTSNLINYDSIKIGVTFEGAAFRYEKQSIPFPTRAVPVQLINAWEKQLDSPHNTDTQFNVNGHIIYASSIILSNRSEYFCNMFQGHWAESIMARRNVEQKKELNGSVREGGEVNMEEESFPAEKPIYTDRVTIDNTSDSKRTAFDIFYIADKYLIKELRQIAKLDIVGRLSVDSVTKVLFEHVWKWEDLKKDVIVYFVENFDKIRDTDSFKNTVLCGGEYSHFGPIWLEIFPLLRLSKDA